MLVLVSLIRPILSFRFFHSVVCLFILFLCLLALSFFLSLSAFDVQEENSSSFFHCMRVCVCVLSFGEKNKKKTEIIDFLLDYRYRKSRKKKTII